MVVAVAFLTELVKFWVAHSFLCRVFSVKESKGEWLGKCEDDVVHQHHIWVKEGGASPHVVGSEPHLDEEHGDVLVEAVDEDLGHPGIVPCTVDKEETLEKAELCNGEVCTVGRLQTFVS